MKDFLLDENGELVIEKGRTPLDKWKIPLVSGNELKVQQIKQVLRTHKGEWEYDPEEGIDRYTLFTKKPNDDHIQDEIKSGLLQVDEDLRLTKYKRVQGKREDGKSRDATIYIRATNDKNEDISIEL